MPLNFPNDRRTRGSQPHRRAAQPSPGAPSSRAKRPRKRVVALTVLIALLLVGAVAGTCYVLWQQLELNHAMRESQSAPIPEAVNDTPMGTVENPIDFEALQAENPDIYAWIYIPGTNVNYPILKHPSDDSFYLNHNQNGDYAIEGAVYSESVNAVDFSDPVTLLYGHCLVNGSMFSSLHDFKDKTFFDEHDTLFIYRPGSVMTYRIIAAYEYDDRHIIKTNDFSDQANLQAYFDEVTHPASEISNVREGSQLNLDDTIVQLSTCTSPTEDTDLRYIVTGVLSDEQQTN